jgi:hypothetical protein
MLKFTAAESTHLNSIGHLTQYGVGAAAGLCDGNGGFVIVGDFATFGATSGITSIDKSDASDTHNFVETIERHQVTIERQFIW